MTLAKYEVTEVRFARGKSGGRSVLENGGARVNAQTGAE